MRKDDKNNNRKITKEEELRAIKKMIEQEFDFRQIAEISRKTVEEIQEIADSMKN